MPDANVSVPNRAFSKRVTHTRQKIARKKGATRRNPIVVGSQILTNPPETWRENKKRAVSLLLNRLSSGIWAQSRVCAVNIHPNSRLPSKQARTHAPKETRVRRRSLHPTFRWNLPFMAQITTMLGFSTKLPIYPYIWLLWIRDLMFGFQVFQTGFICDHVWQSKTFMYRTGVLKSTSQ